jgi:SAM-dependent methyltransferase
MQIAARADRLLRRINPTYRLKKKHEEELRYWRGELIRLRKWFENGSTDWWGIRPPTREQQLKVSEIWETNAVLTMHHMRPSYLEELQLNRDYFLEKRVLEIGSGPLVPILQFEGCIRHCVDPLVGMYLAAGWPLFDYDAKFLSIGAESLPYPDGYFDAAISVNALDHVDDFERVASEMQRVVKHNGGLYFEVEYHAPTVAEPIRLSDARVVEAFSGCELNMVVNRSGREMFEALVKRFDLLPNPRFGEERFVTWHGVRR